MEDWRRPIVGLRMYWPETLLLVLAWVIPLTTWAACRSGFQRSGSLMVFCAAIAEFFTLNRANTKHLRNAERVRSGQDPLAFSKAARIVGWIALVTALAGTLLWGYGDLLPDTRRQ
jgi:hypothetical protein